MSYPLYKNFYKLNINDIQKIANKHIKLNNVKIFENKPNYIIHPINKIKYNGKLMYIIIEDKWLDNIELNSLTDYFTQKERIKCNFKNNKSPLNYYNENKKELIKYYPKNIKEYYTFNDIIFSNCKFCNNFRISVCLTILNMFKPRKWLDISAGWGDRLISAILYSNYNKDFQKYYAADPNPNLQKYYNKIIKTFKKSKENFTIIQDGFEYININDNFDLVLTSPPFFDTEIYSNDKHDSLIRLNNIKDWYNNFLIISIKKASQYLINGGYMILYIEIFDKEYNTKRMINDISKELEYIGTFYYIDTKLRGFYIWKKIEKNK